MSYLQDLLAELAAVLMWPVAILLVALSGYTVIATGGFCREAVERRLRRSTRVQALGDRVASHTDRRRALDEIELRLGRRIDRDALVARIAPMLGLAGTLIPLGPGLRSLGQDDLGGFGDQIVIAFSTTVAGLFIAGIISCIAATRSRWYEDDMGVLEHGATS